MNKTIGLQLIVYSLLLAGLSYLTYYLAPTLRMKSERLSPLVAVIGALHLTALSMLFGLRHIGHILAAAPSATLIWGVVCFLDAWKRRVGFVAGVVTGLAVQQVAYQVWQPQLPGFWWPLAHFWALQFLIALGISHAAKQAT